MTSNPFDFGSPLMKSIEMSSHIELGMLRGNNSLAPAVNDLFL